MEANIKPAWLVLAVCGLLGCAPITPLPTMGPPPLPAPQPPGMPSSGLPSSGVPSIPGGQPSQPSGGQPPSSGQPSGSQSGSPGAPSSGGAGDPSSYDQLPIGGLGGENGNDAAAGEAGPGDETGGEAAGESGEPGGESGPSGSGDEPSWQDIAGTGDGETEIEGGDGWEVSNEIPGNGSESDGNGDSDGDGAGDGDGDGESGSSEDEFQGALEDFDGEILAELEIAKSGAGQANIPTPGDASAGATSEDNTIRALPRRNDRQAPSPPPPRRSGERVPDNIPDAKDDDIIARQLREAAMVEVDPELKEKLWEEYRKYKKG